MTTPTQEAVEAACRAYEEAMWKNGGSYPRNKYMEAALTAAFALRPAGDAGEVAVKALEWNDNNIGVSYADTPFGRYRATNSGWWFGADHLTYAPSKEAAKSAAQADYDRRIRSALAAPVRSPDAGVKEAGRKLAKAVWGIDFVEPPQPPEQEAVRVTDEAVRAVKEIKTLVVAAFNNPRLAKSTLNSVEHKLEALATALASAKPEGWRLVPVEPTDAMLKAAASVNFENEDERGMACNLWHVMLAAAPAEEVKL